LLFYLLGFAPDHGDGSLEAMLLIALVTIIAGLPLRMPVCRTKVEVRKQAGRN